MTSSDVRAPRPAVPNDRSPVLRAGRLSMTFDDGAIRWVRFDDDELVRGIYAAVRDADWRTIAGEIEDLTIRSEPSHFDIAFTSHHREAPIDFRWTGRVVGDAQGSISFTMDGIAGSTFKRNRIGICVLHPMGQTGAPLTLITPDGEHEDVFPVRIATADPFTDVSGMRIRVSESRTVDIGFEGDVFETEDQRNWTDASFKTFSTPHRLPIPVTVEAGTRIRQSVSIHIEDSDRSPVAAARHLARRSTVEIFGDVIGATPFVGTSLAPGREELPAIALAWLDRLRLARLRVVLEVDRPHWKDRYRAAAKSAKRISSRLEIEAVANDDGEGLAELVDELGSDRWSRPDVHVFPRGSYITTERVALRLRELANAADVPIRIGGGSRAHYNELNRGSIPAHLLDIIGFPISPQVHAFDDASVMETIDAQAVACRDARRRFGDRELVIGPITLLPRFNPYSDMTPQFGVADEPFRRDPRQDTWFAAAWTLASLASLSISGATAVSYHEAIGPAGLISEQGPTPAFDVLCAVQELGPSSVYRTTASPGIAALALGDDAGWRRLLIANLTGKPRSLDVRTPARSTGSMSWRVVGSGTSIESGQLRGLVDIGAFEVVRIDSHGVAGVTG